VLCAAVVEGAGLVVEGAARVVVVLGASFVVAVGLVVTDGAAIEEGAVEVGAVEVAADDGLVVEGTAVAGGLVVFAVANRPRPRLAVAHPANSTTTPTMAARPNLRC
jgi:hypothetical protein